MKKFELTYNPFTHERTFLLNGKTAALPNCWGDDEGKSLSEWSGDFFKAIRGKYNDSEMEVRFKGIIRDLEFLEDALETYRKDHPTDKITIDGSDCVNITAKLDELKNLFAKMQAESPFSELKSQELKDIFEKAVSSEFEIAVVATMSSGKSTLINAMLGCDLLPTRNAAATATLARIHDKDDMVGAGFKGTSYDANGNPLETCNHLTRKDMETMNANPNTATIEIEGDIIGIESNDIELILTDTPGPNNCRTEEHKERTYKVVKADYKPMVLYVLNATQPKTDDDNRVLTEIADAMMSAGRQSQERFLFVLNKADQFKPEDDGSIEERIEGFRQYLADHNIKNARVFPTDAYMAKIIRQKLNGMPITPTEEDELIKTGIMIKRDWRHFSKYAPLPLFEREKLLAAAKDARIKNDEYSEALIHTGIPAVELAITEYLTKYALPMKIEEGVRSFLNKIKELGIEARATEELKDNEDAVEKLRANLDKLESDLKNGKKSEYVMRVIDGFSIHDEIEKQFEQIQGQFTSKVDLEIQKRRCSSLSKTEAQNRKNDLLNVINDLNMQVRIDMERAINKTFAAKAQDAINVYKKYLEELTGELPSSTPLTLGYLTELTVDSIGKDYVKKERIKAGYHKEKAWRNSERGRKLGKTIGDYISFNSGPWGWGLGELIGEVASSLGGTIGGWFDKEHEVADYKYETRYDFSLWLDKDFYPRVNAFVESRRDVAINLANRLEKDFKASFKAKFSELEEVIKQKIKEKKKAIADKESLEKTLVENERRLEWLKKFITDLDKVLAI